MHQKAFFFRLFNMNQNFNPQLTPKRAEDLMDRINLKIASEQKKAVRRRTVFFTGTFIISMIAIMPAYNALADNLAASGFMDYFSLLFSDWAVISRYWQNFVLSLLEVLPVMSLAAFLTVIFVILESLKHLVAEAPAWQSGQKLHQ